MKKISFSCCNTDKELGNLSARVGTSGLFTCPDCGARFKVEVCVSEEGVQFLKMDFAGNALVKESEEPGLFDSNSMAELESGAKAVVESLEELEEVFRKGQEEQLGE